VGELDDYLVMIRAVSKMDLEIDESTKSELFVDVKIKAYQGLPQLNRFTSELHLFGIDQEARNSIDMDFVSDCNDCKSGMKVFKSTGILLRHMVSDDVLASIFWLHFGEKARKEFQFRYLGPIQATSINVNQFEMFHRSVLSQEVMLSSFNETFICPISLDSDFILREKLRRDCEAHMSKIPSNSPMIAIPLPVDFAPVTLATTMKGFSLKKLCQYVESCALKAQVLIHNINLVRKSQQNKITGIAINFESSLITSYQFMRYLIHHIQTAATPSHSKDSLRGRCTNTTRTCCCAPTSTPWCEWWPTLLLTPMTRHTCTPP